MVLKSLPIFDRAEWRPTRFADFADSINDRVEPADARDDPYVGLDDLDSGDPHIRRWGKGSDVIGTKLRFRKGDIIFGRRRAYQRKLAVADFDGICSAHAMVVRAKPNLVLPEFLPFLMMSDRFMRRAIEISVGSLSPTINWSTLRIEEFDLPPLQKQKAISEIFAGVECSKTCGLNLLLDLRQLRQAELDRGFVAVGALKSVTCDSVMSMQNGRPFPSTDYQSDGVRLIRPGNLGSNGYLDWSPGATVCLPPRHRQENEDWYIGSGQVLINLTAQSLEDGFMGRVCYTRNEDAGLLNQRIGRFVVGEGFLPEYIFRCLQTKSFRVLVESRCEGSKVRHLYFRHFRDHLIPVRSLNEQRVLCDRINDIEAAIVSAQESVRRSLQIRQELSARLFG